ncbi:cytochrome P450 3A29-like [Brachionus plicatilis]|uniref:Cytochrome P450 3A29-like n=1 Tax=Brachionus plicatilis TaxID=10195 RepID=A0A3M7PIZ0_BRAPC|nr:cytochrome P450 3A29-like [Brachionus plicatilis]
MNINPKIDLNLIKQIERGNLPDSNNPLRIKLSDSHELLLDELIGFKLKPIALFEQQCIAATIDGFRSPTAAFSYETQIKKHPEYLTLTSNNLLSQFKSGRQKFMFAGYETTSTTLTYASFILAKNSEEQQKLYDLLKSEFDSEDYINPDSVQKIEYLDWFVKEVLRIYPIVNTAVGRRWTKSTVVKGIDIPEDTVIVVDVMSLHFDPELWGPVDPNEFHPLRHDTKRNPLAFMAFGNGPRNCIGMQFAMLEPKIALRGLKIILKLYSKKG